MKFKQLQTNGYKQTEIGEIPIDWDVVKIGDVLEPEREKIKVKDYKGKLKIVQKIPFNTGEIVLREKKKTGTDLYVSDAGHLLTSKINFHQGAVAITKDKIAATTHYEFYKVKNNSDILFLWYFFRSSFFKNLFSQEIKYRGYKKEANYKFIKDFKIPLPPIQEQKNIAKILLICKNTIQKTEQAINSFKEFKKSMMEHLFTYGPVSLEDAEKVKLKETEIGKVPKDWDVGKVVDFFDFTKKPKELKIRSNEEVPFIPMEKISESKKEARYYVKKKSEIKSSSFALKNDLIIAKITPCFENGKQALLTNISKDYCFTTTEVIALHQKEDISNIEYLYYLLKDYKFRNSLIAKMEGTTGRKRLPRSALKNLKIPLPNLQIQEQIAKILSAIDKKIEAYENKKKALEELFKSMLHNLMRGRVRANQVKIEIGK